MTQARLYRKLIKKDKIDMTQQNLSYYVLKGYIPYKEVAGKKEYKYKKVVSALERAGLLKGQRG